MKIHAILNAEAGAMIDADADSVALGIQQRLRASGNGVELDLVQPGEIDAAMDHAIGMNPDVLAIGGGDGTILAAAKKLSGTSIILGIIPLGTLNRLARDLKIPFDSEQAAGVIVDGKPSAIDVAEVNGQAFLCTSLLGLPIHVAEERQKLRGAQLDERVSGYFALFRNFLSNRRRFAVEVDDGKLARKIRALSIAISNNPLSHTPNAMLTRAKLDSGQLALYLSKHRTGGGLVWAVLKRMLGYWDQEPEVEEVCATRIVLRSKRSKVRVSNDGEIVQIDTPLEYKIKPGILNVMTANASAQ